MSSVELLEKGKGIELRKDFEPLVRIQSDIYVLSVPIDSKINSFEELIESSKESALIFGGISPGGLDDLTLKALAEGTGNES